jgi:2-deoxy-D-gluconate 3-dehydrogenase
VGLAQAGATLLIAGRNAGKNAAAVKTLQVAGAKAAAMEADVTGQSACRALVEAALARFGRLDILVNNAGINIRKQPQDYTQEEWKSVLDTNLTSAFLCSQAAYPAMLAAGGGKIINIGSMLSIFGAAFAGPYGASKGGVMQLTKSLACAWAKDNIQVNAVLPGWIDTDLTRTARKEVAGLHERVLARTPAARWGPGISPHRGLRAAHPISSPARRSRSTGEIFAGLTPFRPGVNPLAFCGGA